MLRLDSNQIANVLPHRFPLAMVDRIVDGEEGSGRAASSASAWPTPRSWGIFRSTT